MGGRCPLHDRTHYVEQDTHSVQIVGDHAWTEHWIAFLVLGSKRLDHDVVSMFLGLSVMGSDQYGLSKFFLLHETIAGIESLCAATLKSFVDPLFSFLITVVRGTG